MDERPDLQPDFEERWHEWSRSEPKLDERQLKANLLEGIPDRRSKNNTRLVLVAAAAASLVVLLIGYESSRQPVMPPIVETPEVVYVTGDNVILVLREGADPIYVLTEPSARNAGE